jgi:hypothetical protein
MKLLEAMADEGFVWTHSTGQQLTRKQMLDQLGMGQLKYSMLTTRDVTIAVYGTTAIVRGVSSRQRSAVPGSAAGDASPLTVFYTMTLINRAGEWKAVAMHTSRPPDAPQR